MIQRCDRCISNTNPGQGGQYQDRKYGRGIRVFNEAIKRPHGCTVCGGAALDRRSARIAVNWLPLHG